MNLQFLAAAASTSGSSGCNVPSAGSSCAEYLSGREPEHFLSRSRATECLHPSRNRSLLTVRTRYRRVRCQPLFSLALPRIRSQAEETVTLPARAYAELPNVTRYWLSPSTGTAAVSRCE